MVVLGINASHNATACVLVDGKIISCIQEERLSRIKNQSGLPVLATKEALKIADLKPEDVDLLVLGFEDPKVNAGFAALPGIREKYTSEGKGILSAPLKKFAWWLKEEVLVNFPKSRGFYDKSISTFYKYFVDPKLEENVLKEIEKKLEISRDKVVKLDHHTAHAYSALFSSPDYFKKPRLVLTLDAMGDAVCSTVSIFKNGKFRRIATTPAGNSIGDLYAFITAYLGMKMGEHEYKVMGIAPYASEKYIERVYNKIKDLIWVNKDLTFGTKIHSHMFYKILPDLLAYERFDNISGAIQRLTEELLITWVKAAVKKTGIRDLVCGGGVFMNVKANQKILELPEVKRLFIMPSCGDESTAIGAAYWGYATHEKKKNPEIVPLKDLYFGPEYNDKNIEKELKKKIYKKFKVKKQKDIEKVIAELLSGGKAVARFSGRLEWGARALGNRSILSHPADLGVIRVINEQIKSRDFWMPFAPAIMEERQHKYIVNRKNMAAPYMIITFNSTNEGRDKFKAAMHQYDFSLRPQIVMKKWNLSYWKILREFEKLTGIGGVLNTSFNLHGYPIICSPRDALEVFKNSELEYLAIESYLVSKK